MTTLRITASILALTFATFVSTSGQQTVPPPPKPADSGPSLAVTMKFIQDKLNDIGKVSFVVFWHDTKVGNDGTNTVTEEVTNATAAPNQCRIAYHWKVTSDGTTLNDSDGWFLLRDVQDIVVKPYEQYQNEASAAEGFPNLIASSTNPPLTAMLVRRPHVFGYLFPFTDPQLADRFAKAMTHAVELCGGGGNKDPF
jgi:hypothetical protein